MRQSFFGYVASTPGCVVADRGVFCGGAAMAVLFFIAAVSLAPTSARAQGSGAVDETAPDGATTADRVEATPKGTIGLGLIGAELGLVIPAVSGLTKTWSLVLFPIVGAGAGAVAGYFGIDNPGQSEAAVAVLAVGMGLLVPAIVGTVLAASHSGKQDKRATDAAGGAPPGSVPGTKAASSGASPDGGMLGVRTGRLGVANGRVTRSRFNSTSRDYGVADTGLLRFRQRQLSFGVPAMAVKPTFSQRDVQLYGVRQYAQVHVPLVSGKF